MGPEAAESTFEVATLAAGRQLLRRVGSRSARRREPPVRSVVTYYDTFDWRLHGSGRTLATLDDDGELTLRLGRPHGAPLRRRVSAPPAFAWELPDDALREELTPILEMRRLLPIVRIERLEEGLAILDGNRKTVAGVRLIGGRASDPDDGRRRPLGPIVRTRAVRGYDAEHQEIATRLAADPEVEPSSESELARALAAIGRAPGDDGRLALQLQSEASADSALRTICGALVQAIQRNEEGTRRDLDSEFLHDFRVAVRRTRSALTQIKGVFAPQAAAHFKREFAWLGKVTGPTRDMDVYLLTMPRYRASLPAPIRGDLEPLDRYLKRHQRLEQRRLVRSLSSQRYGRLLEEWRRFLAGPPAAADEAPLAATPVLELASERIWRAYSRVLRKGRAISPTTGAEALHRLRIDGKKLRYLLEFFRSLYPPKKVGGLIKALKGLQDNLGDFNDAEVQQVTLKRFAHEMTEEKLATVETLMAMGRLVERLEHRQAEERRRFHSCFDEFTNRDNRALFKSLFRGRPRVEA